MPNFRFYMLDRDGRVLNSTGAELPDDAVAEAYARNLLDRCHAVDFLRGALLLGHVERPQGAPALALEPSRRNWLFKASEPPAWFERRTARKEDRS